MALSTRSHKDNGRHGRAQDAAPLCARGPTLKARFAASFCVPSVSFVARLRASPGPRPTAVEASAPNALARHRRDQPNAGGGGVVVAEGGQVHALPLRPSAQSLPLVPASLVVDVVRPYGVRACVLPRNCTSLT